MSSICNFDLPLVMQPLLGPTHDSGQILEADGDEDSAKMLTLLPSHIQSGRLPGRGLSLGPCQRASAWPFRAPRAPGQVRYAGLLFSL